MLLGLMALLVVMAGAGMTYPLWRTAVDAGQRRQAANVAAYRQRLAELEADAAAGLVDAETASSLRAELDARLLRDTASGESDATPSTRHLMLSVALGVLVLGFAIAGYFQDGSWKAQMQIAAAPQDAAEQSAQQASIDQLLAALAQRLEQNPNDVDGWALLGRSYFAMQRFADAAAAYAKANAITAQQEPDLLTNEGEALAMASDRNLVGRPQALFTAALALDPAHVKALWYAGLSAEQSGDAQAAKGYWISLSQQQVPDNLRAALDERLHALGVASAAPTAPSPTPMAAGAELKLAVSLAPELAEKLDPQATLFVFARAAEGPPMPLAVYRGKAGELPLEVQLDDSMAMMPTAKLSQFERWIVTARVSRAGQVQALSGDLQGTLTVARDQVGDAAMALVINEVVP